MGFRSSMVLMMVAMVLMIGAVNLAEAQSDNTSCAQELIPCAQYLKSPNPPNTCCDPLKKTVQNELTCLCNIFFSPGLLQGFNVSVNDALQLSRRCGVTSDLSSCKQSGSAPPPTSGSGSGSSSPPATPGGDKGGAGRVSFTGLSFLLLFLASLLFN